MPKTDPSATVIVYSKSVRDREFLRTLLSENGFNPICFGSESICIDNIRSLQPKIVIARTESDDIAWRFVIALNLLNMNNPLILLTQTLNGGRYGIWPFGIPVHAVPLENSNGRLVASVRKILREKPPAAAGNGMMPFLGESDGIAAIRSMLPNIAASDDPVMITGEAGVGKELLSRHIAWQTDPASIMVRVDCDALPSGVPLRLWLTQIIEQEHRDKPFVLLVSNLHCLARQAQIDLLLFMDMLVDWRTAEYPGPKRKMKIIANAESNLDRRVKQGAFRDDLYYRLNVIPITVPPLRARRSDIALLTDYFIIDACIRLHKCVKIPAQKDSERLVLYHWPGNVEELKEYMERVVATDNPISILNSKNLDNPKLDKREVLFSVDGLEALPKPFEIKSFLGEHKNLALKGISRKFVSRTEKRFLRKALELTNWNRKRAAEMLNISYKSMLNKMKAYDII